MWACYCLERELKHTTCLWFQVNLPHLCQEKFWEQGKELSKINFCQALVWLQEVSTVLVSLRYNATFRPVLWTWAYHRSVHYCTSGMLVMLPLLSLCAVSGERHMKRILLTGWWQWAVASLNFLWMPHVSNSTCHINLAWENNYVTLWLEVVFMLTFVTVTWGTVLKGARNVPQSSAASKDECSVQCLLSTVLAAMNIVTVVGATPRCYSYTDKICVFSWMQVISCVRLLKRAVFDQEVLGLITTYRWHWWYSVMLSLR